MIGRDAADLSAYSWPASKLGEAIDVLARRAGFLTDVSESPVSPMGLAQASEESISQWIVAAADQLGLEAEPVESPYPEVEDMVRGAPPALLRLPNPGIEDGMPYDHREPNFLAMLGSGTWGIKLVTPDLTIRRVKPQSVQDALCRDLEDLPGSVVDSMLSSAGVAEERRKRARKSILREQLSAARIGGCWMLRLSPGSSMVGQFRKAHLFRPLFLLTGTYLVQQLLLVFSWWLIGRGALEGFFEQTWLIAWALVLLTMIPFQLLVSWTQNVFSIGVGTVFKQRLLFGTLQLDPEEIRHQGAGQFLGRVMESEAVEMLALSGGLAAVVAVIQLAIAAYILSQGTGGWVHALVLIVWTAVAALFGWRYARRATPWNEIYRKITNDLVERMVGHRTRLAQEDPVHWHDGEDQDLDTYQGLSEGLDQVGAHMNSIIPRGWLILGLLGVSLAFVFTPNSLEKLAISVGGIMLASQAVTSLMAGMLSIVGVVQAWGQVKPLFNAASRYRDDQSNVASLLVDEGEISSRSSQVVVEARDLVFRYREYGRPVLQECTLQVRNGERLLLEGPSGGGKSTLASILAGLRSPESGLLLLWGFDRQTMGLAEWRRRVVSAPQFHENHVLTETFAFNLLMGRRWPPSPEDLEEAEEICRELGLGEVLDRMPAGLQQMVGESGWQLSHGEQSRLFIARALLQKADLMILDESFAALDPKNLHRALRCVLQRAPTMLVIAHP